MNADSQPQRKILHLDLDAFFCAVEEKFEPALRGKAFAVGGSPDSRGVVASCSYAARKFGVHSAMPMARAVRLCPDLIIVSHGRGKYSTESKAVMEIVRQEATEVQQISIDEAFLDVSDQNEPAAAIARRIQARILGELLLPNSIGVATNKLVAKIASDFGKAQAQSIGPPNAICVVPPGEEVEFLAPLPTKALWGVGPKTAARLAELGIYTIGDIARQPPEELARLFGKHGESLAQRAQGIDNNPVAETHEVKSISREVTFPRDVSERDQLLKTIRRLSDSIGGRLRKRELTGATVKIKVRWPDFTTFTRQITLLQPSDQDDDIYTNAVKLFDDNWVPPGRPVRLLGVGVSGLGSNSGPSAQLSLWDAIIEEPDQADPADVARQEALNQTVESLQERFGDRAIQRGSPKSSDHG